MTSSIFDLDEFKPYAREWRARQAQFARCRSYYDGSIYSDLRAWLPWLGPRLSARVRPLYLPLARAVNLDAGLVPGGWTLDARAVDLQPAVDRVLGWSEWVTEGVLYVRNGAILGHSGLKVSDLREQGRVVIKPLSPERFVLVPTGPYDRTPALAIVVELRRGPGGEQFEYAEVVSPETVRTFAGGEPVGFGGRPAEYANELGFVPFVEVRHIESGLAFGESTFESVTTLLDGVNELATDLGDIIRRHAAPQWAIIGAEDTVPTVKPAPTVDGMPAGGALSRGNDNVWLIPAGGDAKAMVAPVDIAGVLDFIREARDGVHAGLPELAFDELRKKDSVATATVELQLKELVIKIGLVRPNYDEGFVHALRMAGRAAATMARNGGGDRALHEIMALDSERLALDSGRDIIPLDPLTRARIDLLAFQAGSRSGAADAAG